MVSNTKDKTDKTNQQQNTSTTNETAQTNPTEKISTTDETDQFIQPLKTPTDIVFENNLFKLIVEKAAFQRQKRFRFQDHLFYVKIEVKESDEPIPFLKDILDFLQQGLLHLMENLKTFYNENEENICYLTLHQNPMVIGLNSGKQRNW